MRYDEEYLAKWDDLCAKASEDYQDCVFASKTFEATSKDFLAALKMEIRAEREDIKMSESELECRARADRRWKDFRHEQLEVLRDAGRKQIKLENARRRWETARSGIALKRAEFSRLGSE